jgi:PAS domain S-box-containing protein
MAILSVTALYVLIFVWVSWRYLRDRDPLLLDVMWVFATMAMLFVLGIARLLVGEPPRVMQVSVTVLLLAQPLLSLRLVSRFRAVPRWLIAITAVGWALMTLPVVLAAVPLPPRLVWPVVLLFFAGEATAAWLFGVEGRRRGGAARIRLWCAAGGTALFGAVLLFAGRGDSGIVGARVLAVISAVLYMAAFVPPRWLRRAWSTGAAYAVTRRLLAAPVDEPAERTWQRYCDGACAVLGVDAVVVLLPAAAGRVRAVGPGGSSLADREYDGSDVQQVLGRRGTIDALAGWTRPPRAATELAEATDTRFVTAAPLMFPTGAGALILLHGYRSLFADDDVALFTELAGQCAALAQRADTLAERQRLAVIVESSPDAIIGKALDGTITSWNSGAEHLYGYRCAEMLGRHATVLVPADQQATEARLMRKVVDGEHIDQHRITRCRKDGTVITVALTLSPIIGPDGRTVGVASISRDITDRERAEAMFEGLLEAGPDAIVGVNDSGTITLFNAQAERLFGYRRKELLGRPVDVLIPERLRAEQLLRRSEYFADPKSRQLGSGNQLTAVRKDGTEFPAEISLSALKTDQGVIVSAAVRDVTERLVAQAERERLIAQAERDAGERRLQHARRLESLGQLAGGVAHDFNNILAVVANYTELLIDTLNAPQLDEADLIGARNDLAQISRAAERATQLTKQLLAFGRRDIIKTEVLNLNHVIGDVGEMLRRSLGEHIHLITHLDPQLRTVRADSGQIEQILLNLAVNARDAMPTGGTLSIDTTNADLEIDDIPGTGLGPGHYVRLRVSDTGTGMSPEVIERAFEPFYTTKPPGSGTGLGLATVYGIATAAGGDVHLYSESDIGTTVTVVLPALESPADVARPTADTLAESDTEFVRDKTVLLVEDEAALRQVTTRILTRKGYRVLAADGGAQAIHIAQSHPGAIDLLLTDVIMPKMLGNEVATHVQAIRHGIPVLYMSGYAQPVLTENGTLPPGVAIVEKPFTGNELLHDVRTMLHSGNANRSETRSVAVPLGHQAPTAEGS